MIERWPELEFVKVRAQPHGLFSSFQLVIQLHVRLFLNLAGLILVDV